MGDVVQVEDLVYRYPGSDTAAVRGASFSIAEGEIFGFLGPSGAGKSTTQKILIKLLDGFDGSVRIFDRSLAEWGDDFYESIGVSFELPASYRKLSARENLEVFAALYSGDVVPPMELLEMVGLAKDADQRVAQYSKGMQMRLNVARALLNRPKLLFLDEPTGGLDPGNARRIKEMIVAERDRGTTVFLTTHDMMVADELCDRVAFIVDGEIPVIDNPRELKLSHGSSTVRIEHDNGSVESVELDELPGALSKMQRAGRTIETVHTDEATLEQVFMKVTGRELR
jgi:fluoroquinolone transport system ATP-binding protein